MKLSYNWLREYVAVDLSPERVGEILTDIGLEVEEIEVWESHPGGLSGVVAGKVLTCSEHPAADRLKVAEVNTGGDSNVQIVCGAPNIEAGQIVLVAGPGSVVVSQGKRIIIRESEIRGVTSAGMICSEAELGLGNRSDTIMLPGENIKPGTAATELFEIHSDHIYSIGLTPNRIESGYHYGAGRDLAAFINLKGKATAVMPPADTLRTAKGDAPIEVIIENSRDCHRYCGITISNVRVGESPTWLKNRLSSIGLEPVNNIVDITNFVLMELGQPLHAFDADKLGGKAITVGNLADDTEFTTLDGVTRKLSSKDLMICCGGEPLCIAGVLGGLSTGVTGSTTTIFLESAWFNPVSVRRTAKRHGISTDASFRFERGADVGMAPYALKRAALLIREIAGGDISTRMTDIYPVVHEERYLTVSTARVCSLIGKRIEPATIRGILSSLGFSIIEEAEGVLTIAIPTSKEEIAGEADIAEEILRIYGYNNIDVGSKFTSSITIGPETDTERVTNMIADMLTSNGFHEMMSNSLVPDTWFEKAGTISDRGSAVKLVNPLSSDLNQLRCSLLPGGLNAIAYNINRQNSDLRLFEFGRCYSVKAAGREEPAVENFIEKSCLSLFLTGALWSERWNSPIVRSNFFHAKAYLGMILGRLGIEELLDESDLEPCNSRAEGLEYSFNNEIIATICRVGVNYRQRFGIEQDVFWVNIEWDRALLLAGRTETRHKSLPRYPSVRRDLALLIEEGVTFRDIRRVASEAETGILRSVDLFDLYRHTSLGKGKKSYAVSFILRDDDKTLNEERIRKAMSQIERALEQNLGATVRS